MSNIVKFYPMFGSFEREQREREQWRREQRGMVILHLIWMFLKLSKGRRIISLFICNFVNMVRVNLIIYSVKHFYAPFSLQISLIWGIKNKGLEVVQTPPNPSPSFFKKYPNKVFKLLFLPLLYSPFPQHPNIASDVHYFSIYKIRYDL